MLPKQQLVDAAIVYDFDGTLARGNIQEHLFLPKMDRSREAFWDEVKELTKQHDADEILVYMWRMLDCARAAGVSVTAAALQAHGREVPLFEGVPTWFKRITEHAQASGVRLQHYVIASGVYEILQGCEIFNCFEKVFASKFIYDEHGNAAWPGLAINYTTKTQFLFRINKGIKNVWNNEAVNRWVPETDRPIPFDKMIFIGDGDTDIPSFKMIRHKGGHSIAVFDPEDWQNADGLAQQRIYRLISQDRVNSVAPADYTDGSQLDITVKGILGRLATRGK